MLAVPVTVLLIGLTVTLKNPYRTLWDTAGLRFRVKALIQRTLKGTLFLRTTYLKP